MKNKEYSVVVLINGSEYTIDSELESIEEAQEVVSDLKNDEYDNSCYDFNFSELSDGGEVIIKQGDNEVSREEIFSYYVIMSADNDDRGLGAYMTLEKARETAKYEADNCDNSENGYSVISINYKGNEVEYYNIKRKYEAVIVCDGREYPLDECCGYSEDEEEDMVNDVIDGSDNMIGSLCAEYAYNYGAVVNIVSCGHVVSSRAIKSYKVIGIKYDGTEESIDYTMSKMYAKRVAREAGESGEYLHVDILTK